MKVCVTCGRKITALVPIKDSLGNKFCSVRCRSLYKQYSQMV